MLSFFKDQQTQITIKNRTKNDGKILITNSASASNVGPDEPWHHPVRVLLLIFII